MSEHPPSRPSASSAPIPRAVPPPAVLPPAVPPHAVSVDRLAASQPAGTFRRPPLVDGDKRVVRYLRLSVTDRCNFRCAYCMPAEGVRFVERSEILTFEEVTRLVACFVRLGIDKVRLTGGEPLLRRDISSLIRGIRAVPGVTDIALTTNGIALPTMAAELAQAGLSRVNVSIDSLRPDRFDALTRTRNMLPRVLAGLDAALAYGLSPVKLNAVVVRGFNDDELGALVTFAGERGVDLRFIEYMPIGTDGFWAGETFVSTEHMLERLADDYDIAEPLGFASAAGLPGGGPAVYRNLTPKSGGPTVRVGFISALSHNFCSACNRVRVGATGELRECLAFEGTVSLRDLLRAGVDDDALVATVRGALYGKGAGHSFAAIGGGLRTVRSMSSIGG